MFGGSEIYGLRESYVWKLETNASGFDLHHILVCQTDKFWEMSDFINTPLLTGKIFFIIMAIKIGSNFSEYFYKLSGNTKILSTKTFVRHNFFLGKI